MCAPSEQVLQLARQYAFSHALASSAACTLRCTLQCRLQQHQNLVKGCQAQGARIAPDC